MPEFGRPYGDRPTIGIVKARSNREVAEPACPETLLVKAMHAGTMALRTKYARKALECPGPIDPSTHAMLLRQLYLSAMERRKFTEALGFAEAMLELEVLADVAHQDAARACLGQKDLEGALGHLRLAARKGPASRRAFHLSMLGALLYLNGRATSAILPLEIAVRWSTTDRPTCLAQLALAKREAGDDVDSELVGLRFALEHAAHHRGYDEYLLGELCAVLGDERAARHYFESFIERVTSGRVALAVALKSEIGRARRYVSARKRSTRA